MDGIVTGTNGHTEKSTANELPPPAPQIDNGTTSNMTETGIGTAAATPEPSPSKPGGRSRRKAIPRKVVIEEDVQPVDEIKPVSDGMDERPPRVPVTTASEATTTLTPEEMMLRIQDSLAGQLDISQIWAQILAGAQHPLAQSVQHALPQALQLQAQTALPNDGADMLVLLQQQMNTAQQQLAALAAFPTYNPTTPDSVLPPSTSRINDSSAGTTESPSTSRPASQPQRGQKRKLFESHGGSTGQSGTVRSSSLETMSRDERIEYEDLEQFAALFKKQRIKCGFTQGDVGQALGRRYGTDFSQTTISRFEAMNLSFKNMCKLRPLLKEWLTDTEQAIANGATVSDLIDPMPSPSSGSHQHQQPSTTSATQHPRDDKDEGETSASVSPLMSPGTSASTPLKKRRKRTNLDMQQRQVLDIVFKMNPRPSHEHMGELADQLKLERDVVRVWFCNRRQKMRKVDDPPAGMFDPSVLQNLLDQAGTGTDSPKRENSESPALEIDEGP